MAEKQVSFSEKDAHEYYFRPPPPPGTNLFWHFLKSSIKTLAAATVLNYIYMYEPQNRAYIKSRSFFNNHFSYPLYVLSVSASSVSFSFSLPFLLLPLSLSLLSPPVHSLISPSVMSLTHSEREREREKLRNPLVSGVVYKSIWRPPLKSIWRPPLKVIWRPPDTFKWR